MDAHMATPRRLLIMFAFLFLNHAWAHENDLSPEHLAPKADITGDLTGGRLTVDTQHIREDLEAYFNVSDTDFMRMSPEQLRFFYFELHDFDKNRKMDGLEMIRAVLHIVEHDKGTVTSSDLFSDIEKYAVGIDEVLALDDIDNDGFLSYEEFAYAQQRYMQ